MTNTSFINTKFVGTLQMRYSLKLLVQCLSESDMELSMYIVTETYFSSTELKENNTNKIHDQQCKDHLIQVEINYVS